MRDLFRRWGVIAACVALVSPGIAAAQEPSASVTVSATPVTRPLPDAFLGLAFEFSSIPVWASSGTGQPNPVLVQLIRNLNPRGRPVIRIGGLTTDHSWWPVPGMREPPGVTYTLTPAWAQSAKALAAALNARLVLGVNLEADSTRVAATEAQEFLATIGWRYIGALDIGNEPPLYSSVPWYHTLDGRVIPWYTDEGTAVFGRSLSWGPESWAADYARILAALPRVPIAGPDTEQASWFADYTRFLSPRSQLRILASHGYGLNSCVKEPGSPAYPSLPHMVSSYAIDDLLPGLAPYIQLAHQDGATFRVDEMGSITCNGRAGVSNTMAAALWATGALFTLDRAGVDGVNLHSYPGLTNALFDFSRSATGWSGAVRPLYYGALTFARAAPPGSRLLAVTLHGPPSLHAWATAGPGRSRRVLLLNDSLTQSTAVTVPASPGVHGAPAQLDRLSSPGASATGGVTLGGHSFGSATATGTLAPPVADPVRAHHGEYRVSLPAASAAVLTFPAG